MRRLLVASCVSTLASLALMTWQLVDPRVFPIIVAMSLGQILGTMSFAMYGYVVLADYRALRRSARAARAMGAASDPPIRTD
jgi:hypothetical protein